MAYTMAAKPGALLGAANVNHSVSSSHRRRMETTRAFPNTQQQRRRRAPIAVHAVSSSENFDNHRVPDAQFTNTTSRREALFSLASLAASPSMIAASLALPPNAEAGELAVAAATRAQTVYAGFCIPIIEKCVTAPLADVLALAIHDAGTFDAAAGTGGLNGSIRFELDRPENQRFKPVVEQLEKAKREIDSKVTEPIGWADLIALAPAGKARYAFLRDFCGGDTLEYDAQPPMLTL